MSNNKIAGTYEVSPAAGYAGDVAPATAWKILSENKDAVLIDVPHARRMELCGPARAGSRSARSRRCSSGRSFPSMQPNPEFVSALGDAHRGQGYAAAVSVSEWGEVGCGGESHDRSRIQYVS